MIDLQDKITEIVFALFLVVVVGGIVAGFASSNPPLDPEEIIRAEKQCRSLGLEPSYFIDEYYRNIRHIECEEESRTVYY